jgi:beta-glucosidase/6-phospho-beta-glucosidase/beta-galactosidase
MEKNYDIEMDFILEELIKEYENTYKGVNFYAEDVVRTTNEKVTEKVKYNFTLKDWEINIL